MNFYFYSTNLSQIYIRLMAVPKMFHRCLKNMILMRNIDSGNYYPPPSSQTLEESMESSLIGLKCSYNTWICLTKSVFLKVLIIIVWLGYFGTYQGTFGNSVTVHFGPVRVLLGPIFFSLMHYYPGQGLKLTPNTPNLTLKGRY